ncbi:hypothetical protein QF028_004529 [Neobacillus sp. B4I6]
MNYQDMLIGHRNSLMNYQDTLINQQNIRKTIKSPVMGAIQ